MTSVMQRRTAVGGRKKDGCISEWREEAIINNTAGKRKRNTQKGWKKGRCDEQEQTVQQMRDPGHAGILIFQRSDGAAHKSIRMAGNLAGWVAESWHPHRQQTPKRPTRETCAAAC